MNGFFFFLKKKMLQGNHARHVEATKVQVYISLCHLVRFHTDDSVSHCRLLVVWRPATQPLQRLFSPPQERLAWRCRYPNAHSPGSIPIHIYWLYGFALAGATYLLKRKMQNYLPCSSSHLGSLARRCTLCGRR